MKGYFGYIRVSTVKQGEHGSSLQEQRAAIDAYAAKRGLAIAEWFEERETAAKLGRTQFNRMIAKLGRGEARGVIIHKIDRSARNLKDWARLGELIDRGVDVQFAHESLDLSSRGGRLAADIQAVVAADYVRNLRDEVRKGFNGRLAQGLYPLPAPLGYLDQGGGKPKVIDPIKGPLVRNAFELYATGEYPVPRLRDEMERRGLRNRRGSPVSRNGIWHMLRNPFYVGVIHIRRTKCNYPGVHPPLVRSALFERVQAILSGRTYRPVAAVRGFAFSRFITCDTCGRSFIGERQKGHVYYRCHSATCRGSSIRESDVQTEIASFLAFVALDERELKEVGEMRERAETRTKDDRAAAVRDAKLAIGKCDDLLERLTDGYLDGTIDRELYERRKMKLLRERCGYQDIVDSPPKDSAQMMRLKKLELAQAAILQADLSISTKSREAVSTVVSNLVARGKNLGFIPSFPFDEVAKERLRSNGEPYQAVPRNGGVMFVRRTTAGEEEPIARVPEIREYDPAPSGQPGERF